MTKVRAAMIYKYWLSLLHPQGDQISASEKGRSNDTLVELGRLKTNISFYFTPLKWQ